MQPSAHSQTQTGDYIVVHFLDEQPDGMRFLRRRNDWPLHITLLPWFAFPDEPTLQEVLELIAQANPCLDLRLGEEAQFGPDTRVSVIAGQYDVSRLHAALLMTLEDMGIELRNRQWAGEHYTAHVTHHDTAPQPQAGDEVALADFSLVRLGEDNRCEVIATLPLGAAR